MLRACSDAPVRAEEFRVRTVGLFLGSGLVLALGRSLRPAFTPALSVIVGQSGEKTAAATISPPQNRTKHPRQYRSRVTVGQKRRHATRMAHNAENSSRERRVKWDKTPQLGWCCGASDAYDPQSGPQLGGGRRNPGSPGWKRLGTCRWISPRTMAGPSATECRFSPISSGLHRRAAGVPHRATAGTGHRPR